MIQSRRSFFTGLAAFVAAPAIVRATSLMPVRRIILDTSAEDIYALLAKRILECETVMRQNMANCLYGGRLAWADGATINFTEVLPEQVYTHLEHSVSLRIDINRYPSNQENDHARFRRRPRRLRQTQRPNSVVDTTGNMVL